MSWKPRASQLGYYMQCSARAAFDRARDEGRLVLTPEQADAIESKRASSPYADLGTLIHYATQRGVSAVFDEGAHEPTPEQAANAAKLFKNDATALTMAVRSASILAAGHLAQTGSPGGWRAEVTVKTPYISGHIDFIGVDARGKGVLVDLKTTSRPPGPARIKSAHLAQVLIYAQAFNDSQCAFPYDQRAPAVESVAVLYVDALKAAWALPITVDITTEPMQEYMALLKQYADYAGTDAFHGLAIPQMGSVCEDWCAYTSLCRDRYQSPLGAIIKRAPVATMNPFGTPT